VRKINSYQLRHSQSFPLKASVVESPRKFFGLPLWAIALGADWERGESRGHARGIFAFGDIATGWFTFGELARGFLAFGGLAIGLFAFGDSPSAFLLRWAEVPLVD
jgi:hypothetical protein